VVFIILCYFSAKSSDKDKRKRYNILYNLSSGNFDNKAKEALDTIDKIEHKTPIDEYRAGNILEYNVLQGIVEGHTEPNRMPLDAMLVRYTRAVGDLGQHRDELVGQIRGGGKDFDDVLAMMNHIEELVGRVTDDLTNPVAVGFLNVVATEGPLIRQDITRQRREIAAEGAQDKSEAIDNYFTQSKTWTSDPQNVHDSSVNINLRDTIGRIKSTCSTHITPTHSINEAIEFAKSYKDKNDKIMKALKVIKENGFNSTLTENEADVFMYVWERSKLPENEKNSDLMKEAVIDALVDCNDTYGLVCMNGRCGRLISSLALLDYDEDTSKTLTTQMIRNKIFDEVNKMIAMEINTAKTSSDSHTQLIGKYYAGEIDMTPDDSEFRQNIERKIDIIIGEEAKQLTPIQINSIKTECMAAF
jgi:NifU-like protein involved in Fe-S cluster formation